MPDVLHDLALQIRDRREDAARDDVALDLGETELDLIQPRRVGGSEVQLGGTSRKGILCTLRNLDHVVRGLKRPEGPE